MSKLITKIKRTFLRAHHVLRVKYAQWFRVSHEDALRDVIAMIRPSNISEPLIRIGSENDGGYLLPESTTKQDVLISPGVSWNSSFELFFARSGTSVILFDASVDGPAKEHENFHFNKKFWGVKEDAQSISARNWIKNNVTSGSRNLLQIDIEGAEIDVILELPLEELYKFDAIVIEIHQFQKLLEPNHIEQYLQFFRRLTTAHKVVHFHPNNNIHPVQYFGIDVIDCLELTLVRNDYPNFTGILNDFELHSLDSPCVPEEVEISVNWSSIHR